MADLFGHDLATADEEYLAIRNHERHRSIRTCLEAQWNRFSTYADSNFLDQFWRKGHFNSRVWEMRVGCALLDAGKDFTSDDAGPDFSLVSPVIHIEAVAPEPSDAIRSARQEFRSQGSASMPDEDIFLCFTSAIAAKRKQYAKWATQNIVSNDQAYVVALSGSKFGPHILDPENPLVLYPLFGLGAQTVTFDEGNVVNVEFSASLTRTKPSGAPVDNFLFRPFDYDGSDPTAAEVSAVVFSDRNFRCDPSGFDDFVLIHNPAARNPLPEGFLPYGREHARRGDQILLVTDHRVAK